MEPISIGIGAVVAKWAVRLWVKEPLAVDAAADLIDVIKGHVPDFFESRRAGRQFEQISDEVALRIQPLVDGELVGLPQNERLSAALAARKTLELGLMSPRTLVQADLDPVEFERLLRLADPEAVTRAGLGDAGTALYDILINETCNYITQIAEVLPLFQSEATRELLSRESEILVLAHKILDGLPAPRVPESWGAGNEDDRFANRYLKAVTRRADELRLFGVEQEAKQRYSLSVAYISLTASAPSQAGTDNFQSDDHDGDPVSRDTSDEEQMFRVEAALGGHPRLLIGGGAGSGKTTLLQWIAITACRRGFSGDLEGWNGSIPFIIPLRRYAGSTLPTPEEFLAGGYSNLAGLMPPGWVSRLLDSGSALLLIDGLDELPETERDDAKDWLLELMQEYPESKFVLTSRPLAISTDWSTLPDFRYTELQPMQRPDIRAFVAHWHAAARDATESVEDREQLIIAERHMLSAINEQPTIRGLCESPLLCALICALHRDSVNQLPQNKMELYDTALRMLILTRDVQREIHAGPTLGLSYPEKRALLEDFALWLHENGASDASEETFRVRVATKLKSLPHVQYGGAEVAADLLARSGVLRKPVEDRVDFVHRTFLEYLAAAALIQDEAIDKLVLHSHLDQWREVVVMASGHATLTQRDRLIRGIVDRGNDEPRNRHRLFLLAVACRETARVLNEGTVQLLAECLKEILPPKNMTEAAAVASAGQLAIAQLAGYKGLSTEVGACVRALSLIGTDEAMEAIKTFSEDPRKTVARQVIRAWGQFEGEKYAMEVLASCPLDDGHVVLTDPENMQYLPFLGRLASVFLDAPGRVDSVLELAPSDFLIGADISHAKSIESLLEFSKFPNLGTLWMKSSRGLKSLAGAQFLSKLRRLNLEGCYNLKDISALRSVSNLDDLNLVNCAIESLSDLGETVIADLRVGGSVALERIDLPVLAKRLIISASPHLRDVSGIAESPDIEYLNLACTPLIGSIRLPPNIRSCALMYFFTQDSALAPIIGGVSLRSLTLHGVGSRSLPAGLEGLDNLELAHIHGLKRLKELERFSDLPHLLRIEFWGHVEGDLPIIPGFEVTNQGPRSSRITYTRKA